MNLENSIKDAIGKKLEDGTIENLVAEQLEKGVKNALENLFRSHGDVTKIIEEKVKSVMIPYLESYDYSKYITKLDSVLVEVLKSSALENKKMLSNFKQLIIVEERTNIKVTELFEIWKNYVAKNVNTHGLEINYDDSPSYESVKVTLEINKDESRSWSSLERATLVFECQHDEELNFEIILSRYTKSSREGWDIVYDTIQNINSLRYINEFEILLMKLRQNYTNLIIDVSFDEDEVYPENEPEVSLS